MADQGYFGNQFIQNLLRSENKMSCIAWWSLIQKQAPTMQLRAFASAVVMIQSFPCSAASVERVNSTLGHSMPLECSPKSPENYVKLMSMHELPGGIQKLREKLR